MSERTSPPEAPPSSARPEGKTPDKEARLAAKLRENLRRRKAQAQAIDATAPSALPKSSGES